MKSDSWISKESPLGFTLIECLVALFAISIIMFFLKPVVMTNHKIEKKSYERTQLEWHVFLAQLDYETNGYTVVKMGKNKLVFYVDNIPGSKTFSIDRYQNQIRKNIGYEPLLMNVEDALFSRVDGGVWLKVKFQNKQVYEAFLPYEFVD